MLLSQLQKPAPKAPIAAPKLAVPKVIAPAAKPITPAQPKAPEILSSDIDVALKYKYRLGNGLYKTDTMILKNLERGSEYTISPSQWPKVTGNYAKEDFTFVANSGTVSKVYEMEQELITFDVKLDTDNTKGS